jgi:hypothetical protein
MRRRTAKVAQGLPPKGVYANYFEIGQTAFEFVLDFGQQYHGQLPSACHTRIVTSPTYARALLETLAAAVEEHGQRFEKDK